MKKVVILVFTLFAFASVANAEVGFREVKIGTSMTEVKRHCVAINGSLWDGARCFGIDDLIFNFDFDTKEWTLSALSVDIGPIYQTILDKIIGDPDNPYSKLKQSLDNKYRLDWEFTERDRKLFNEGERDSLWSSYNNGQVFSEIKRIDAYSELRLLVHYHQDKEGRELSTERSPKNAAFSDF